MLKKISVLAVLVFFLTLYFIYSVTLLAENSNNQHPEIHCKHFFYGYPAGTPPGNDLIIRDIYALSNNDTTKFADWVAYRLTRDEVNGSAKTVRTWKKDPWLAEDETLVPSDYKGANKALKVDRGHQAPMASLKGTGTWYETNYLSNITPQKSKLNRGPWKRLEYMVRNLINEYKKVYIVTGPLYQGSTYTLPAVHKKNKPHTVPSGYWKIIFVPVNDDPAQMKYASFYLHRRQPRQTGFWIILQQ